MLLDEDLIHRLGLKIRSMGSYINGFSVVVIVIRGRKYNRMELVTVVKREKDPENVNSSLTVYST
jgi:hypothetical protein